MPFEQHQESIDLSQERLGELEPVEKYENVWKGKVDKAQEFCNKKAAEIEDDTVIDKGLAKIAVILENTALEGAKETHSEVVLKNLITGLERNIEKIESGVASEIEMQEMYDAARELLGQEPEQPRQPEIPAEFELDFDMPQFEAERMYGFAETPSEHEFQQLVDSMESEEEKRAFLTSITSALSESNEFGIEVSEQQSMRLEQLQLFSMMMQMFVTEFGDESKFLGSQVRNQLDETMGIDTRGTAAQFEQLITEGQLEKYQYEIMLNPNASLKDIIPTEAFMLIEMRTTLPRSQAQTEGLHTVAFRDPVNRTELHEKKQNILNWFRYYSHYGEVSSIIEEDLKAEITAAMDEIEATELMQIEEEIYEEIKEMKEENLAKWRSGYEGPSGEWVPAMTEQQIKYFLEGMEGESRAQKQKQYALREKFDPDKLPSDKRDLWEIYNDTFDPKDEVTNLADSTWDTIRKELIINVPMIMASGGLASLAKKAMSKAAVWTAGRMGLLSGMEIAYQSSRIVRAGAFVGLTLTEGVAFEVVHSMALKQLGFEEEWLAELNLPQAMQRVFWSTVTLGLFHGAGKVGQGFGKSIDQAGIKILGEAARKVTDSGTRKLLQEVLIAGNMEAFTMLLMGAVQTGIYEGSMEAFWGQMTSHEAIFHAYLAAYSLKAGHHATRTFAPITSRAPSKKKAQRDKPNPEVAGAQARTGVTREFAQGEVYITSRGNAEVLAVDAKTGEVKIKLGEGESARVETVKRHELDAMISDHLDGAFRPQEAGVRAEKTTVETRVETSVEVLGMKRLKEFFQGEPSSISTPPMELADYLAAGTKEPVNVGTGSAAIAPKGVEIGTNGLYGCLGVFVRGPNGNAVIHMTPSTGFPYEGATLQESLSTLSSKLSKLGPLSELEVTIVHNAPIAIAAEGRFAEVQGVRGQFEQSGFGKVALVEVPFAESGIHFDPASPGQISVVGARKSFDREGEMYVKQEINYDDPIAVQLGVDRVVDRSVYEYSLDYTGITLAKVKEGLQNGRITEAQLREAVTGRGLSNVARNVFNEVVGANQSSLEASFKERFPSEEMPKSLIDLLDSLLSGSPQNRFDLNAPTNAGISNKQRTAIAVAAIRGNLSVLDRYFTPEQKRILIENAELFN